MIAPLDWGLGHATRCIPLIKNLIECGCEVIIATEGKQQVLLQEEFKHNKFVVLTGYRIKYSNNSWKTIIKILFQIPKILNAINSEHQWLRRFLKENKVDAIIADNRYGFSSPNIPSIFITHQLTIKTSAGNLADQMLQKLNYLFIGKFAQCWIPDFEGENNLAGNLSHPKNYPKCP